MTKKTAPEAVALTARQSRFVDEYLIDLNAAQAYQRAGYKAKGNAAETNAIRLLRNAQVKQAIQTRMSRRSERTQIDADYILHRLFEIDQMDVLDILNDDGSPKPISEWPKVWRITLSGLDISRTVTNFDESTAETILKKIKWPDKLKNIELLGKHVSVKAFEAEKESAAEDMATALAKLAEKLPG
ncbi:terminase small subunit [Vreelandella populi]|uniref:terminase small subunit n=1 Tax=Vreelandella populi TaxID=2498858 RepID=UPI000F8D2070|nr:terminase small subunit [Halomonas populi]RUR52707.1 terminase small subunit [Halomonas populi]